MVTAQQGSKVQVHYVGKLDDGTVFDSSEGKNPLEFTIGDGQLIPGFDQGVIGMELGQSKTLLIPPEEGYGFHRPEGMLEIQRWEIDPSIPLEIGTRLQANQQGGGLVQFTVIALESETVKLDSNHPLAGKDLTFEVQLVALLD